VGFFPPRYMASPPLLLFEIFFISIGVSITFLCFRVELANFVDMCLCFFPFWGIKYTFFGDLQESLYKIVNRKSSCGYATHFLSIALDLVMF
jgi:hypothetical protein